MRRQRSVSDSKYCPGNRSGPSASSSTSRPSPSSTRSRNKLHSTSCAGSSFLQTSPSAHSVKNEKDSSKAALTQVLHGYNFVGKIIKLKSDDDYGFLKSEQISGDVFFSLHHTTGMEDMSGKGGNVGKFVTFSVKDGGKKSMEARKIHVHQDTEPSVEYLTGIVDRWVKTGCLIQITSGLGAELPQNRIFAAFTECSFDTNLTHVEVKLRIHMDKSLRVEARDVNLLNEDISKMVHDGEDAKMPVCDDVKGKLMIKDLTNVEFCEDFIKSMDGMSIEDITNLFETSLKLRLAELSQQPIASKVIISLIRKVANKGLKKIEESITRMIMANFLTISSCKQGCLVVQAALENFEKPRRVLIAEQLTELGTVEEFSDLWTHGGQVFIMMLEYLDESSLAMIGSCLQGSYVQLACSICHYKPLRSLLNHLVNDDSFEDIFDEITEELMTLSCDKFGHHIIIGLLETVPEHMKQKFFSFFKGKIFKLSLDSVCFTVIVTALKQGTSNQQAEIIEEVCRVTSKQAEMDIIQLAQDKFGHQVVLAMLSGTRHRQIHNILKASILCKQEEMLENEFAARVFKAIKTEFHNKLAGNYPKSH